MKHVFYIHSPVTYLVSKAIIDYAKLDNKQILFLKSRGIEVDDKFKSELWPYTFNPQSFPTHLNIFKSFFKLKMFDEHVERVTDGQKFVLYLPQTSWRHAQLLISHKNCHHYNVIEEGLGSYRSKTYMEENWPNNALNIFDKLSYFNRIKDTKFIREDYSNLYGLSEESFPQYERKLVLKNFSIKNKNYTYYENSVILVFDAVSVYNLTDLNFHLSAVDHLLSKKGLGHFDKYFFKLHPAQLSTVEEKKFKDLLSSNKNYHFEELPINISLEEVALCAKNVNFYVNISSVGLYASIFNAKVYSYSYMISMLDPSYENVIKTLPDVYIKNVSFL
jgi:hypothetical protein